MGKFTDQFHTEADGFSLDTADSVNFYRQALNTARIADALQPGPWLRTLNGALISLDCLEVIAQDQSGRIRAQLRGKDAAADLTGPMRADDAEKAIRAITDALGIPVIDANKIALGAITVRRAEVPTRE